MFLSEKIVIPNEKDFFIQSNKSNTKRKGLDKSYLSTLVLRNCPLKRI